MKVLASAGEATDRGEKEKHLASSSMHDSVGSTMQGSATRRKLRWVELDDRKKGEGVLTGMAGGPIFI